MRDGAHEVGLDLLDEPVAGDVAEGEDTAGDGADGIAHHRLRDRQPDLLTPAHDRNEPVAWRPLRRLEAPLKHVDGGPAQRNRGGNAGDPLGGAVPEDDLTVPIDRDDPIGGVGEDRDRPLPLECDALVQLGVRERRRRACGHGEQGLDLLLAPLARDGRIDGEDAQGRSLRPADRYAQKGHVAVLQHRVEGAEALVLPGLREREWRPRLDDVTGEPAAGLAS